MWKFNLSKVKLRQAVRYAVFMLIAVILFAIAPYVYSVAKSLFAWNHVQNQTLQVLQSKEMRFLVTNRLVAQIVVESDSNNPILGKREGYLIAKARLYYGVDFDNFSKNNIRREGTHIIIFTPEPKELDFAVDLDSMRYLTKRTGLQVITDWVMDRDLEAELRSQFRQATYSYLREEKLLPKREQIVRQLNGFASLLNDSLGVKVEFR